MPDEDQIKDRFNLKGRIQKDVMLTLCQYRFEMHRFLTILIYHAQYAGLAYFSRYHWRSKHT